MSAVASERAPLAQALSLTFSKKVKKKYRTIEAPVPPARLADTHAHLFDYERSPERLAALAAGLPALPDGRTPAAASVVLARAAVAGVARLTTIWSPLDDADIAPTGTAYEDLITTWCREGRELLEAGVATGAADSARATSELFGGVRFLAGVHPYGACAYTDAVHAAVAAALACPACVGVGEIGLDYHFDAEEEVSVAPHELQQEVMARQLELARAHHVPVELHIRNDNADEARTAHADALAVLDEVGVPEAGCVLHCFGEDPATMERFLARGCFVAFGGAATFKRNEATRAAFAACPPDRILFETDCPYMAPEPLRGLTCEPAMIAFTADALVRDRAARTGEDPTALARAAFDNAVALFERVAPRSV